MRWPKWLKILDTFQELQGEKALYRLSCLDLYLIAVRGVKRGLPPKTRFSRSKPSHSVTALQIFKEATYLNTMSMLELLDKSIDAIVNEKWLVRVNIVVEKVRSDPPTSEWSLRTETEGGGGDTNIPPIEALMAPSITVRDVKALITRLKGFRPADQRLYTQRGEPRFAGILNASGGMSLDLKLHVIPLNPKVEALFEIVHMGNADDRDSMMEQLITPREPKDCPCNTGSLFLNEHAPLTEEHCNSCHRHYRRMHTCLTCGFTMCRACFERDNEGRDVAMFPYDDIKKYCTSAWQRTRSHGGRFY